MRYSLPAWTYGFGLILGGLMVLDATRGDELPAKVTFDQHIKPILREHCSSCHNANEKKSGLSLDNYTSVMEGGSGGDAAVAGDLDSSRIWALTAHVEEPKMPPNQDKISDDKLALIKRWIEQGMPENDGSKIMAPKVDLSQMGAVSLARPDGPLPMPESLIKQTPLYTPRPASISALAASPWSPLIAVGGQEQVSLYHSENGSLLGILPFPEGEPQSITFSRDGKLILVGGGRHSHSGYAVLYEIKTGKRVTRVGDELDIVMAADISEDNSKIALAGPQKMVRVYDTVTGELIHDLKKHTDWIYAVRFSPDGILLATADRSNGLVVWESDSGKLYLDLIGHKGEIRSIGWRPDSQALISCSLDGTVKVWDMNAGKLIKSWDAHGGGVYGLAICNDGTIASTGNDKKTKLWDPSGTAKGEFPALGETGLEVAITADGKEVAVGDMSGAVKLWNRADHKKVVSLPANPATLEMTIEQAVAKLSSLKTASIETQKAYDAASQIAVEMAKNLESLQKQVASTTEQRQQHETKLVAISKAIENANQQQKAKQVALEQAQGKLQELLNRQAVAKAESKDTSDIDRELEAQKTSLSVIEKELAAIRNQSMASIAQRSVAENKREQFSLSLKELEKKKSEIEATIQEQSKKVAAAKLPLDQALASIQNQEELVASAQLDLKAFVAATQAWKTRGEEIDQASLKLAQQQTAVESATVAMQEEQKKLDARTQALKKELDELQKRFAAIEQQRLQGEQSVAAKQKEAETIAIELAKLQSEQESLKLQLETYSP
jgi:WD40 repeat protein